MNVWERNKTFLFFVDAFALVFIEFCIDFMAVEADVDSFDPLLIDFMSAKIDLYY